MSGFYPFAQIGAEDAAAYLWLLWHSSEALLGKWGLFFTNFLFAPQGASLNLEVPLLNTILSLPFYIFFGPTGSYNFLVVFSFVLTFLGFYVFLKYLAKSKYAAIAGSIIFTFSSYRLNILGLGQIDLLGTQWLGFCFYFLFKLLKENLSTKNYLSLGVFLALSAYGDYRTFLITILGLLATAFFYYIFESENRVNFFKKMFRTLLVTIIFVTPLILLNKNSFGLHPLPKEPDSAKLISADVFGYFWPFKTVSEHYYGLTIPFLGFITLASFVYLVIHKKYRVGAEFKIFLGLALGFFLLSLGNSINIAGKMIFESELMPYQILKNLPVFSLFRSPVRFSLIVMLAASVFAATSFSYLFAGKSKLFVYTIFALCIFQNFFFVPSIKFENLKTNPVFSRLSTEPSRNVLFLPFGSMDSFNQPNGDFDYKMLTSQIIFQKPLIGGYLSYVKPETLEFLLEDAFVKQLIKCEKTLVCIPLESGFTDKFDVGYILVNKKTVQEKTLLFVKESLSTRLIEEDDNFLLLGTLH